MRRSMNQQNPGPGPRNQRTGPPGRTSSSPGAPRNGTGRSGTGPANGAPQNGYGGQYAPPVNGAPQNGYGQYAPPVNGAPQNWYGQYAPPVNGIPQNGYGQAGASPDGYSRPSYRPPQNGAPRQAPRSNSRPADQNRNRGQTRNPAPGQRPVSRTSGSGSSRPRRPSPQGEQITRAQARAEMEKTVRARKKSEARAERREGLRTVGRFAVYLLCAVLLLAVLAGGGVLIALHHTPHAPVSTGNISFYYGGTKVRTEAASRCVDDDELYVCFNDLADYLGMKESGSADEMKFILRTNDNALTSAAGDGTEESVVFYTDEHRVVINGQVELLDVPNILMGEEIWVSTGFLTDWMENLSVSYKPAQRSVKVSRIVDEEHSEPENKITVYLPISFRLKKNAPLESIEEDPGIGLLSDSLLEATAYDLAFQTDLSEYEDYMNPQGDKRDAFLILVNADHPLTAGDVPRDLTDVIYTSSARSTQQLREFPAKALEALFKEMHHYGYYSMAVYAGYRSYDYQAGIFEQYVQNELASNPALSREEAEALVLAYSTRPGTSEYQTGLAVDMDTMGSFTTDFAWTTEYYWLQENAWKFGFVLRFPSDKTEITNNSFEPWHYRYVGRYHAKIMHDNGLCLEEYIARISN